MGPRRWALLGDFLRSLTFRPLDIPLYAAALAIVVGFTILARQERDSTGAIEVTAPDGRYIYALEQDQILYFSGPLGDSVIEIADGKARFTESPCRDKVCITSGYLLESGQWSACLPNRVLATITGLDVDGSDIDGMAF